MDGFELLQQVRACEPQKAVPFIVLTTESNTDRGAAAGQAGVSTCIVKSFSAEKFRTRLVAVLGKF